MKKANKIILIVLLGIACIGFVTHITRNKDNSKNENIGKVSLYVETYLNGKNQPTHPNIVKFDEKWKGYKYWMGYTPYPYENGEEENPSITVSNDLYAWVTPKGLANPIANNEEVGCEELKDSHLLYREDLNRLELWYLGRLSKHLGGDGETLIMFRKTSRDGIHWSEYEIMKSMNGYTSPTIMWDGEKYVCWAIKVNENQNRNGIDYFISTDGFAWEERKECTIDTLSEFDIWHGCVSYNDYKNIYELVWVSNKNNLQSIYYAMSDDGVTFSEREEIIINDGWNHLYRPTLLYENNQYYLVYGVISEKNEWFLSMSCGDEIDTLIGIDRNDIEKMTAQPMELQNEKSVMLEAKELISNCKQLFFRLEFFLLIPVLFFMNRMLKKRADKFRSKISFVVGIMICEIYLIPRLYISNDICMVVIGIICGFLQGFLISTCVEFLNNLWEYERRSV